MGLSLVTSKEEELSDLDLELKKKQLQLIRQLIEIFDLLPPEQKKRYSKLLPQSAEAWKKEFCKDCNECYACKGRPATNLLWLKMLPTCYCERCFGYLNSDRSLELYKILEKDGIYPYVTYYPSGISLVSFEKKSKGNDK